jgi:hypothetical protein
VVRNLRHPIQKVAQRKKRRQIHHFQQKEKTKRAEHATELLQPARALKKE